MPRRKGGFNFCYWCRKFRRWEDLRFTYLYNAGGYEPEEIMECRAGTGCRKDEDAEA